MKKRILLNGFLGLLILQIFLFRATSAQDLSATETYIIGTKEMFQDSLIAAQGYNGHVVRNLDDVFLVQAAPDDSLITPLNFTQTCPLVSPVDSLMRLYFKSTRHLNKAAFILKLSDTCQIRSILPFNFTVLSSPLKEINIFPVGSLEKDEFYFDLNLQRVPADSLMPEFLFFEYLLQHFLTKKVLSNKIYTESMLSALSSPYRSVYAPELHFYLEPRAASEVIRKWEKIKQTFVNNLTQKTLEEYYVIFRQKLKLITETSHSKMFVWAKLMQRYGYHQNLKILFENKQEFLNRFKTHLPAFASAMQLIWFCSSEIGHDLITDLQKQNIKGGVRIFMQ